MRGRADEPGGEGTAVTAVAVGGSLARRPGLPRFLTSEHPFPWLLPSTAMMVVFGVYPLLYAIWLSLHKRNPVTRLSPFNPTWNWAKLFTDDRVWDAIGHTFFYTAVAIVIELALGMLIALLLDSDRRGYGVLRALMTDQFRRAVLAFPDEDVLVGTRFAVPDGFEAFKGRSDRERAHVGDATSLIASVNFSGRRTSDEAASAA